MKYYKQYHDEEVKKEVSYDVALKTLLTTYLDNSITREMLKEPNEIRCMCATVYVEES